MYFTICSYLTPSYRDQQSCTNKKTLINKPASSVFCIDLCPSYQVDIDYWVGGGEAAYEFSC